MAGYNEPAIMIMIMIMITVEKNSRLESSPDFSASARSNTRRSRDSRAAVATRRPDELLRARLRRAAAPGPARAAAPAAESSAERRARATLAAWSYERVVRNARVNGPRVGK